MSTSLAQQLRGLAVPQTSLLKRDKTRPSLLFDPREAAALRKETVYQIGLEGLDELVTKNVVFENFTQTLFDISTKSFERTIEDAECNRKLDKHIRKFLLLLSPYFLLNCSHKVLEWLIYRYNIQEYNRESLLMLIIPYHESNIFVRVVQLMKFNDTNDNWYFLKQFQNSGVHLSKHGLLTHAAGSVSFLKFVSKFMFLLLKEHENPNLLMVAFNFYCSVYAGAIEFSDKVKETQVTQILPSLLKGLNSDIPDYCAASYVITAKLVTKTSLNNNILDTFISKISEINVENLKNEASLVLLLIYQSQEHYENLPEDACTNLVKQQWLPKVLQDLNRNNYCIWPLVEILAKKNLTISLNSDDCEENKKFILGLLSAVHFDDRFIETFLCTFLDVIKTKNKFPRGLQSWLTSIVETVERQYPEQFDKQVYRILSSSAQEGKVTNRKKCLQRIFKNAMSLKGKFDVFDKLYHPNPHLRSQAIQYLSQNFETLRDGEKEMIRSSFIDRLNDNNVQVIKDTLSLIKTTSILNRATLKPILIGLVKRCQKDSGSKYNVELSKDILPILCDFSRPTDWEAFIAIFPYLLPDDNLSCMEMSKQLLETDFLKNNPVFLKSFTDDMDLQKITDSVEFCSLVFERLRNDDLNIVEEMVRVLKLVPVEERDNFHKYVASLVLSTIMPEQSPVNISVQAIEIIVDYFHTSDILAEKSNSSVQDHLRTARNGKPSLESFLQCLNTVIRKTKKPQQVLTTRDFSQDNELNRFITLIASALFKPILYYRKYVCMFTKYCCENLEDKVTFLLNLCICRNEHLDEEFIVNCLSTVEFILNTLDDTISILSIDKPIVPYLLACLLNVSQKVRERTLEILNSLMKYCLKPTSVSYYNLLKLLLDQSDEIQLDVDQVPLVISNAFLASKKSKYIAQIKNALVEVASDDSLPIYVTAGILSCLSHVNDFAMFEKLSVYGLKILGLLPFEKPDPLKSSIIIWNVLRLDKSLSSDIKLESNSWKFIKGCLGDDKIKILFNGNVISPAVLLLTHLDKEFFHCLDQEVENQVLDLMIQQVATSTDLEILPAAAQIFKHIDIDANCILGHFTNMREIQSPKVDPCKVKRRISIVPTVDILDTLEWKKGLIALEFIQDKKKVRNSEILIPVFFEILKKCLDFDEQTLLEYPKQLLLSSILHFCQKPDVAALSKHVFNVELIVQCIRASSNPQTHHHALLVLAHSAKLVPEQVLHHIMAIFTFMGSSVLRHDDAYSFQIISIVIETVIPILVEDGSTETIAKVLRVFVSILLDVPEHRRIPLYKELLTKIDGRKNLFIFLLLVFESMIAKPSPDKMKLKNRGQRMAIAVVLCHEFSVQIVIVTCVNLMKYLLELPDEKYNEDNNELPSSCGLSVYLGGAKQFRHYKYAITGFIYQALIAPAFVTHVAALFNEEAYALEKHHKDMIISVLTYAQRITKILECKSDQSDVQYWKAMLQRTYNILDAVNALLTPQMFLLVIKGLTQHNFIVVKRRALEILNMKLQHESKFFSDCDKTEVYAIIPPIIKITELIHSENRDADEDVIIMIAFKSLEYLVKLLIPDYEDKFKEILNYVVSLVQTTNEDDICLSSVIFCLGHFWANLKAHAIESLPSAIPYLFKIMKFQRNAERPDGFILFAMGTAFQKLLNVLSRFCGPYLVKLMTELTLFWAKWKGDVSVSSSYEKFKEVHTVLSTCIESRVLIPAVLETYGYLIEKKAFNAISVLMEILGEHLSNLKRVEIERNVDELRNFFVNALKFRDNALTTFQETNVVESQVIAAVTSLALKLTESGFKPFYNNLYSWATDTEEQKERILTFYSVSHHMGESLKSLFVLFAGITVSNAAEMLDACNVVKNETLYFEETEKNVMLSEVVMKTLLAIFTYDNHKFVTEERFKILMQPLVDQIENSVGGMEALVERNKNLITPCIVMFTVATADDSLWKEMNYQILLKMRNSAPEIRISALHCLQQTVLKIGDDFLPLLPETVPFLNELMEDEDEIVEKACKIAVQEMGKILGDTLHKYFT